MSWRSVDRFRRFHIRQQASIPFLLLLETNSAVLYINQFLAERRDHVSETTKRRSQRSESTSQRFASSPGEDQIDIRHRAPTIGFDDYKLLSNSTWALSCCRVARPFQRFSAGDRAFGAFIISPHLIPLALPGPYRLNNRGRRHQIRQLGILSRVRRRTSPPCRQSHLASLWFAV